MLCAASGWGHAWKRFYTLTYQELLAALPGALRRHHDELLWHAEVNRKLVELRLGQW
jgi:hypothetical protein